MQVEISGMTRKASVEGSVDIELDNDLIHLYTKNDEIHIAFPSFRAMRRFQRFFYERNLSLQDLSAQNPFSQFIGQLDIFYHIDKSLVGRMGPTVKGSWWTSYLGLNQLEVNMKTVVRAFFRSLFKRSS